MKGLPRNRDKGDWVELQRADGTVEDTFRCASKHGPGEAYQEAPGVTVWEYVETGTMRQSGDTKHIYRRTA